MASLVDFVRRRTCKPRIIRWPQLVKQLPGLASDRSSVCSLVPRAMVAMWPSASISTFKGGSACDSAKSPPRFRRWPDRSAASHRFRRLPYGRDGMLGLDGRRNHCKPPRVLSELQAASIAARLDLADVELADQKTTQTTLPRRPTSTTGSEVSRSRRRNGGARPPTAGGSSLGDRLVRSQAAPRSDAAVTTTMIAVTPSMRRFVGMSLASSISLPLRGDRSRR